MYIYIYIYVYICIYICTLYIHYIYIYIHIIYILYTCCWWDSSLERRQSPRPPCSLPVLTKLDEVHRLHHWGLLGDGFGGYFYACISIQIYRCVHVYVCLGLYYICIYIYILYIYCVFLFYVSMSLYYDIVWHTMCLYCLSIWLCNIVCIHVWIRLVLDITYCDFYGKASR